MKRECIIYKSSVRFNRHIAIDYEAAKEIMEFISAEKHEKKFDYISNRILEQTNMYYEDYEQIEDNVTCFRFFPNGLNARIYCQEITLNGTVFCIILSKYVPKKKGRSIDKSI